MTSIEGLGKKFQDARLARGLTLDEAARMTKIRPSRLAEIEADDFSQFPSLAYAKGFLLIYGKFLEVDVTPYMEAFEGSDAGVTVDGYSYLQDNPTPAPVRAPIVRRRAARVRAPAPASGQRTSIMPLILVPAVIIAGFLAMKLILNLQRLAPKHIGEAPTAQTTPSANPSATPPPVVASPVQAAASVAPSAPPVIPSPSVAPSATAIAAASPPPPPPSPPPKPSATPVVAKPEPEVRRAEPVRAEDLAKAAAAPVAAPAATHAATSPSASPSPSASVAASAAPEAGGPNQVAIRSLKKTYVRVVVDDEAKTPAYERWLAPSDQPVEFRGQHIRIKVLERDAIQIKKNGKPLSGAGDDDVTIE